MQGLKASLPWVSDARRARVKAEKLQEQKSLSTGGELPTCSDLGIICPWVAKRRPFILKTSAFRSCVPESWLPFLTISSDHQHGLCFRWDLLSFINRYQMFFICNFYFCSISLQGKFSEVKLQNWACSQGEHFEDESLIPCCQIMLSLP